MLVGQAAQALAAFGAGGDPRARGLQAEQAAARGGDADGAAAVGGMGRRHHARGHGRRRAAAGAAGREREVPGVAGDAVEQRFGGGREAELGRVGLARDDQAGAAHARHDLAVGRRHLVGVEARGRSGGGTGHRGHQFLHQEGNAMERAGRQAARDLGARGIVERRDHGVERRVVSLDARERGVEQFARRHVALPHQSGQPQAVVLFVVVHGVGEVVGGQSARAMGAVSSSTGSTAEPKPAQANEPSASCPR